MNGIKSSKPERSSSSDAIDHQLPEKDQSNEQEKKDKDLEESPVGFSTMSPLQKFLFALSLLLSVLYVVAFAWLIPCKVPDIVDNTEPVIVTEKWKLNFSEIAISTNFKLIEGLDNGSLLFGYESLEDNENGGLMSIHGNDGKLLWRTPLSFIPRFISCDGLGVQEDYMEKCITVGNYGSVATFNERSGILIQTKQIDDFPKYEKASIPARIPDCDSDGTADWAVAYSEFSSVDGRFPDSISIEILSGHNGNTIGFRKSIAECTSAINKLQLWKKDRFSFDILFYCNDNNGFGNIWRISSDKLCSWLSEESSDPNFVKTYTIDQPMYKSFNVLYQPMLKLYSSGENMLVAWEGENIILLNGESDTPYWSYSSNTSMEIRALLTGRFTNDSDNQVAMISSDQESGSVLTILQIETGNKVMSALYPKYFLTQGLLLWNAFLGTDGILVKNIKVESKVTLQNTFVQNNSSNKIRPPVDKFIIKEEYLISHPGCTNHESLKFVLADKVTKLLSQNSTYQNTIESSQETAAIRNTNTEDSLELFTSSTTISSEENTGSSEKEISKLTTIKLLHLSHVLFSRNSTCECKC